MYVLVFDFGGVLMKTVSRAPRWAWDDRLGLQRGSIERIVHGSESWRLAQTGKISLHEYWADVASQLGISHEDLGQFERDFFSGDQLDTEIVEFIRKRRNHGQRTALLSNDSVALAAKLKTLGIWELFDTVAISAEIGVMKPDPAAYQHVLDRLHCRPEQAVFIDDMQANVDAAINLGMIGIHYTPDIHLDRTLSPYFR